MKKIICSLLSAALIMSSATVAYAATPTDEDTTALPVNELVDLNLNESIVLDDGAVITRISFSDYLNETARNNGTTLSEAKIENESTEMSTASSGGSYYYNYAQVFGLDGTTTCSFKAQLQATLKITAVNSYAQIDNVSAVYTTPVAGSYSYQWIQSAAYSDSNTGTFPTGKVNLFGDGYFTVQTQTSTEGSVSLSGLGFSRSLSTSTFWTSQTLHMRGSYQCYRT